MPRISIGLILLLIAAIPASASTPTGVPRPWDSDEGASTTELTVSVKATIAEVGEDATIVIENEDGDRATIQITDGIALRADRKRDFDGRRRLAVADLTAGQRVKVTVRKDDGRVLEIRVLELAAA